MLHLPETVSPISRSPRQATRWLGTHPGAGSLRRSRARSSIWSCRTFFAEGRTPRFEVDSVALLGVALGASASKIPEGGIEWFDELLRRSAGIPQGDHWQCDLVEIARGIIDKKHEVSIKDMRLRTAFSETPPRR